MSNLGQIKLPPADGLMDDVLWTPDPACLVFTPLPFVSQTITGAGHREPDVRARCTGIIVIGIRSVSATVASRHRGSISRRKLPRLAKRIGLSNAEVKAVFDFAVRCPSADRV